MKILINATILSEKNTGLGVYTYQMLSHVCPLLIEKNIEFKIACKDEKFLPSFLKDKIYKVNFDNYFQRNRVTSELYNLGYDIVWSTTQHGKAKSNSKQIITIHDLTPLLYPKGRIHQYIYYKFLLPKIVKNCTYVFTVSSNTKNDILKHYKISEDKVKVVYESMECKDVLNTDFSILKSKYNIEKNKYFCITGIHYFYKNIHSIIETYNKHRELSNYKVLIIGNDNCKYGDYLKTIINDYNLNDSFIFTGFISDEEKNGLLINSCSSLYPSKYEGFGLPILESNIKGVPMVCSNLSSLPEVGGDSVIYFNPDNLEDIYKQLIKIINMDFNERQDIINKGYENVKRFSWDSIAKNMVSILESLEVKNL